MITSVAVLMLILPAVGALLSVVLKRRARPAAVMTATITTGLAVWLTLSTFGAPYTRMLGGLPWLHGVVDTPILGIFVDPLASLMLLVVVPIGLLTVLYSTAYLTDKNREHPVGSEHYGRYYFWLLLFITSMVGMAVSPNFLQFFAFWELTTVCSWALISFHQNERSLKAGFKALLMTSAGSAFLLLAILIIFARTNSFDFSAISRLPDGLRSWVWVFLLIAAWAKAAQVPLQTWLPDAMEAPTPISAYLHAAAMVKAGVYLMARTVSSGWGMPSKISLLMGGMAVLTIFVALSFYFVQDDLKRLLAYSTIAHLGYVLLGIAIGGLGATLGFRGGVLHIICHGYSKATLFFCAGNIAYVTGTRKYIGAAWPGKKHASHGYRIFHRAPERHRSSTAGLLLEQVHDPLGCHASWRSHWTAHPCSHPLRNSDLLRLDALHRAKNLLGRTPGGSSGPQRSPLGDERHFDHPDDRLCSSPACGHALSAVDGEIEWLMPFTTSKSAS